MFSIFHATMETDYIERCASIAQKSVRLHTYACDRLPAARPVFNHRTANPCEMGISRIGIITKHHECRRFYERGHSPNETKSVT